MTYRDIFLQILHEVTGQPKSQLTATLETATQQFPNAPHNLDKELSPKEARDWLTQLRQPEAKSAVLAWVVRGAVGAHQESAQASEHKK